MILQSLTRHPRRKTVLKVGLFVLKVLLFLPISLLAQTRAGVFTTNPIAFRADSSIQPFGQYYADLVTVTDRPA